MISYLSLFSGIGAAEVALKKLNIKYNLIGFSEIDPNAIKSYCAIHNIDPNLNLGDIRNIDKNSLPKNIDLLTHGSPCTSFSILGKGLGGDKGSGTPSSLMWYSVDIISICKPKIVLWENVKAILNKKHKHNFDKYLSELESLGYKNYWKVLNSANYNNAQNRERIFVISIRNDINLTFQFPKEINSDIRLKDILDKTPDNSLYIENSLNIESLVSKISLDRKILKIDIPQLVNVRKYPIDIKALQNLLRDKKKINNITIKNISDELKVPLTMVQHWFRTDNSFSIPTPEIWPQLKKLLDIKDNSFDLPITTFIKKENNYEKSNRCYLIDGLSPTLTCGSRERIIDHNFNIRYLSALEHFKLMGFSEDDYKKAKKVCSDRHIIKQAGNSIVVDVILEIFKELYNI